MQGAALRDIARESVIIPARALRLLVQHLPQLITIICLGLAGRQTVIWFAYWISSFNTLLANLIMPLAPLSVMFSLILALWWLRPSLPFLAATFPDRKDTPTRTRVLSAGGMLISFLTVYATHGMLKEDLAAFRRAATYDEYINQGFEADFTRAFVDGTWSLIGLIGGTIVLRKIIGYFALAEKGLGFTYLAAYLEVLWMTTVSVFLTNKLTAVQDWALTRRSIAPAYRQYQEFMVQLEDSAGPLYDAWTWLGDTLPSLGQLVTVPIAWLTLGAVVFGTSLTAKEAASAEAAGNEGDGDRSMRGRVRAAARGEAKHAVEEAMQPVAGPLKTTWKGLKTLARAGLVPMVIFCIVFMLAVAVELGVVEIGRAIVGPQFFNLEVEQILAYILIVARAAYLIVVVCLIASGLDFFLRHSYAPPEGSSEAALDSRFSRKSSGSGSSSVTQSGTAQEKVSVRGCTP